MTALPNPFQFNSAVVPAMAAEPAAGPCLTDPMDPAAVPFNSATLADERVQLPQPPASGALTNLNLPDALPVGRYLADADNVSTAESVSAIFNSNLLTPNVNASSHPVRAVFRGKQKTAHSNTHIDPHIMLALADELADELRSINEAVLLRQFGSLR